MSTTVDATKVSVVTNVLFAVAGQLATVDGQAVTVAVRVVKTVEVITSTEFSPDGASEPAVGADPGTPVTVGRSAAVTGQTVVETKTVSVVVYVLFWDAGQLVTLDGHAVMVAVRVVKTVEVVDSPSDDGCTSAVGVADAVASATGQIVVATTMVSVVTKVLLADAGQSGTVDGHAVTVAVRVLRIVDVVNCGTEVGIADDGAEAALGDVGTILGADEAFDPVGSPPGIET